MDEADSRDEVIRHSDGSAAPLEFPAMGVPRSLLYLSVPVGFAFSLLFALRSLLRRDKPHNDPSASA